MEEEKAYTSVEKMLGDLAGGFYVMEQQVDVDVQLAYFDMVKKSRKDLEEKVVISDFDKLFSDEVLLEDKKLILVRLAGLRSVEAFRLLERFEKESTEELKEWSILAYNESKMQLESSLKDQSSVFVSTGMGGKGNALRYFIVLFAHEEIKEVFSDFHIEFIQKELTYTLEQYDSELEKFNEMNEQYISATVLIPFNVNLQECLVKIFDACNQLAPFVSERFIVTNIKAMSYDEIIHFKNNDEELDVNESEPFDLDE